MFFFIAENLSVIATFDPFNINNPPNLKFLGAEQHIEKYTKNLIENLENWNYNNDVVTEFLKLLGLIVFYIAQNPNLKE